MTSKSHILSVILGGKEGKRDMKWRLCLTQGEPLVAETVELRHEIS